MISRQFIQNKPLVKTPAPPKVKNGSSRTPPLNPIQTPEEKALIAAKARKLNASARAQELKNYQIQRGHP